MSCERAIELMIDSLVEPLDKQQLEELQQHVSECESCAEEMTAYQDLWQRMETVAIPEPTAGGLERLQKAVREEFGTDSTSTERHERPSSMASPGIWQRLAAVIVLVAVGAILAIGIDSYRRDADIADTLQDDRARYLLIMTETQEGPELAAQVQSEVQAWIARLIEQGIMESGVAISDVMAGATPPSGTLLNGPVSGIMVIRAADFQEARSIVLDSPIITYGGLIEIRAIRDGGSDE